MLSAGGLLLLLPAAAADHSLEQYSRPDCQLACHTHLALRSAASGARPRSVLGGWAQSARHATPAAAATSALLCSPPSSFATAALERGRRRCRQQGGPGCGRRHHRQASSSRSSSWCSQCRQGEALNSLLQGPLRRNNLKWHSTKGRLALHVLFKVLSRRLGGPRPAAQHSCHQLGARGRHLSSGTRWG